MAQRRAGDDGHVQEPGIAQEPSQLRFFRQCVVEGGAVLTVSRVNEDHGPPVLPAGLQILDQVLIILRLLRLVGGLGQHQHPQVLRPRRRFPQAEETEVLRHDGLQGLVVICAGGPVLRAAEVRHGHVRALPAGLLQIELRHCLEGQVIHAGEESVQSLARVPLTQLAAEIRDLVLLDAFRLGGVVNADQHPEVLIAAALDRVEHPLRQCQLPAPGGEVRVHPFLRQPEVRRVQGLAITAQFIEAPDIRCLQVSAWKFRPSRRAVGPQGVVILQGAALIAHRGRQPHDAVQQPDHVVFILGQN